MPFSPASHRQACCRQRGLRPEPTAGRAADRTALGRHHRGPEHVPEEVFVDLGYRGVDRDNPGVRIVHRGRIRSLDAKDRQRLKRRQAIEPVIGHLKADHRMARCWLKGATGDALNAVLAAAGFNLRWLMRAVLAGRIGAFLRALRLSLADGFTAIKAMVAVLLSSIGTAVGLAAPDRAVQPIPNSA